MTENSSEACRAQHNTYIKDTKSTKMSLKSIGVRAQSPKESLPKPSSNPRSVSLLNQQCDHGGNDSIETDTPSGGEEADGVGAEKPPCRNNLGFDLMEIDSLEEETCLKCEEGGQVLLCCEIGCPIGLHEKCIGSEPVFDDTGNFYCPYCLYRRALARTHALRVKAMEAKKALTSFLDAQEVDHENGADNVIVENQFKRGKESEKVLTSFLDAQEVDHESGADNVIVENQFKRGKEPQQTEGKANIANRHQHREFVNHEKDKSPLEEEEEVEAEDSREHEDDDYIQQAEPSNAVDGSLSTSTEQAQDSAYISGEIPCRNKELMKPQVEKTTLLSTREDSREHEDDYIQQAEPSDAVDGSLNTSTEQAQDSAYISGETPCINKELMKPQVEKTTLLSTRDDSREHEDDYIQQAEPSDAVDGSLNTSTEQAQDSAYISGEIPCRNKELMKPQVEKTTLLSTRGGSEKLIKEGTQVTGQLQNVDSTKQDPIFCGRKRKRIFWTAEEEEMLKEGVHIISSNVNKNISWKKVLEFGAHKFHPSRTPSELKDKWKAVNKGLNKRLL